MNDIDMKNECCLQCGTQFNTSKFRKLTESCGHVMCRHCAVISKEGCIQCKLNEKTVNSYLDENESNDASTSTSPAMSKVVSEFVNVELTETPTLSMISLRSEKDLIRDRNYGCHPIFLHNPKVFTFTYSNPDELEPCVPVTGLPSLPSETDGDPYPPFSSNQTPSTSEFHGNDVLDDADDEDGMVTSNFPEIDKSNAKTPETKEQSRRPSLIPHFITVLCEDPPSYQCNICRRKFKTRNRFKYHVFCGKDDVNTGKPYKCEYEKCGKGFIDKSRYEYHLGTHKRLKSLANHNHYGNSTRTECKTSLVKLPASGPISKKRKQTFPDFQALRIRNQDYQEETPSFLCNYCDRSFPQISGLSQHLITHFDDDLPFKCSICGIAYKLKHDLVKHIEKSYGQPKHVAEKHANDSCLEYIKRTKEDRSLNSITTSSSSSGNI